MWVYVFLLIDQLNCASISIASPHEITLVIVGHLMWYLMWYLILKKAKIKLKEIIFNNFNNFENNEKMKFYTTF